jgi:hypothetical protein
MIWCRECKKISECGGALSKKSLRCKQHEWLKRKEWRDSAKKKGRTRKKGPDIYKSQSLQERNLIADAFEHSLSYIQIAQKLKVTPGRVRSAIKSGFASPPINNKKQGRYGWLTSSDIEKIMGWDKQTIRRNRKFIGMNPYGVSRNNSSGPNSYIIKIEKFEAWLRKKEFWMLWEVDDILDPFWRNHCLTFRDGKEFWLWYGHAEKIIFYSRSSIFSWIKQKKLPATSILGRWYVWNSDLRDYMLKNYGMKVEI